MRGVTYKARESVISQNEYDTAWHNWYEHCGLPDPGKNFMTYLTESYVVVAENNMIKMSEEAARRIRLLSGPHSRTIIAAYKARK